MRLRTLVLSIGAIIVVISVATAGYLAATQAGGMRTTCAVSARLADEGTMGANLSAAFHEHFPQVSVAISEVDGDRPGYEHFDCATRDALLAEIERSGAPVASTSDQPHAYLVEESGATYAVAIELAVA